MNFARQFAFTAATECGSCPANNLCSEQYTELGCSPELATLERRAKVLYRSSPDFSARFFEVNGFDFNISARPQRLPNLPRFVSRVRRWKRLADLRGVTAVAVPISEVSPLVKAARDQGCSPRDLLRIGPDQLMVVTGFEHDRFLEKAWSLPTRLALFDDIRSLDADLAVAWGFSVWQRTQAGWVYPRLEHLYNLKRSLVIYAQLQDLGVPTVPHTYWGLRDDITRWTDWLRQNPNISLVAVDLQTVGTHADWQMILRDLAFFHAGLPRPITCLFSGVCDVTRVIELRRTWPESIFSNFGPFFAAAAPNKSMYGLGEPGERSPSEAFYETTGAYEALMNRGVLPEQSFHRHRLAPQELKMPYVETGTGRRSVQTAIQRPLFDERDFSGSMSQVA